jgi:hypothetical protein
MSSQYLSEFEVAFKGPPLTRMTRGSLSAARIRVVQRRPDREWGGQRVAFTVAVEARDAEDAIERVRAAIEPRGAFEDFGALGSEEHPGRIP